MNKQVFSNKLTFLVRQYNKLNAETHTDEQSLNDLICFFSIQQDYQNLWIETLVVYLELVKQQVDLTNPAQKKGLDLLDSLPEKLKGYYSYQIEWYTDVYDHLHYLNAMKADHSVLQASCCSFLITNSKSNVKQFSKHKNSFDDVVDKKQNYLSVLSAFTHHKSEWNQTMSQTDYYVRFKQTLKDDLLFINHMYEKVIEYVILLITISGVQNEQLISFLMLSKQKRKQCQLAFMQSLIDKVIQWENEITWFETQKTFIKQTFNKKHMNHFEDFYYFMLQDEHVFRKRDSFQVSLINYETLGNMVQKDEHNGFNLFSRRSISMLINLITRQKTLVDMRKLKRRINQPFILPDAGLKSAIAFLKKKIIKVDSLIPTELDTLEPCLTALHVWESEYLTLLTASNWLKKGNDKKILRNKNRV